MKKIIKIKNNTKINYNIEKIIQENNLKGLFVKELLNNKNNYNEKIIEKSIRNRTRNFKLNNMERIILKINKIKINSYGKIKNKEIKLNNNLNIIYGKNESGKSTILNFIFNILYGIQKNKNGKEISDYEKYKPWDSDEFSGKITYELDNKNKYEIYREFNKKKIQIYLMNKEKKYQINLI